MIERCPSKLNSPLLFIAIIGLALLPFHIILSRYAYDDSYIHFRIARNLAEHAQPYYNLDEPVLGSSSIGWTILLASLCRMGFYLPRVVPILNAFLTAAGAVVFVRLLQDLSAGALRPVFCTPFAVLYVAVLFGSSVGMMEPAAALLLVGIGALLLVRDNPWGSLFLSIAVFFRPELMLVAMTLGAAFIIQHPNGRGRLVCTAILGAVLFVIFDLYYFGTVIPHPMVAKQHVFVVARSQVLSRTMDWLWAQRSIATTHKVIRVAGFLATMCLAVGPNSRRSSGALLYGAAGVLSGAAIVAAYTAKAVFMMPWYEPLYVVPFLFGTYALIASSKRPLLFVPFVFLMLPLAGRFALDLQSAARPSTYRDFLQGARVRKYLTLGAQLYRASSHEVLMTAEIGGLGWTFRGRILDACGLVTPSALAYHPMHVPDQRSNGLIGAIPTGFIAESRPGIIVSYDVFIQEFLQSLERSHYTRETQPAFNPEDIALTSFPEAWTGAHLNIFRRR
jgi:hypothetical protein